MDKERFINFINKYIKMTDNIDKFNSLTHSYIYETNDWNFVSEMFYEILSENFTKEQIEDIDWWLYDRRNHPDLIYKIDDKIIPSETVEDLWNIICAGKG